MDGSMPHDGRPNTMRRAWHCFGIVLYRDGAAQRKKQWTKLAASVGLLAAAKALALTAPLLFKAIVDSLGRARDDSTFVPLILVVSFVLVRVFSVLFAEFRDFVFATFIQPFLQALARLAVDRLLARPYSEILTQRSNETSATVERGIRGAETYLSLCMFSVAPTAIELLIVAAILVQFLDYSYALVVMLSALAFIGYTIAMINRQDELRRRLNSASTEFGVSLREALSNIEVVKSFHREPHETERGVGHLRSYGDVAIQTQLASLGLYFGQALIVSAALGLCLWFIVVDIQRGAATVGALVMLNMYLIQLYDPLSFFSYSYRHMRDALIDFEGVLSVATDGRQSGSVGQQRLDSAPGAISLNKVSFSYPGGAEALQNIDASVARGSFVAIVGASGAGKSTLAKLIVGLLVPTAGSLTAGRAEVGRGAVAYVPQDPQLFTGSVLYNIAYGLPQADMTAVVQAAKLACAHDFICDLPKKYEDSIGDRGSALSGGQRQRIAIARALATRAEIVVLDEATSAVDMATEVAIIDNIRVARLGGTAILITHRLSSAAKTDMIFVLEKGRLIETGTHKELLALEGMYANLFRSQHSSPNSSLQWVGGI